MAVIEKTTRQLKEDAVNEICQKVSDSSVSIISGFRGLSVPEISDFRKQIRETGGEASVYKNTLLRFAFDHLGISCPDDVLFGPTLLVTTSLDAAKVSKVVKNCVDNYEGLNIKGGVLDKQHVDEGIIKELAELPGREELISKTVGLVKGPLTGLVFGLKSPISGLINVLNSIQNKKQEDS